MRIRVLASVHSIIGALDEGKIYDVPENDAAELILLGRAVRVPVGSAPAVEAAEVAPAYEKASAKPAAGKTRAGK